MNTPNTMPALAVRRTLYCGLLETRVSPERCREVEHAFGDPCCIDCPRWAEVAFNAEDKAAAVSSAMETASAPIQRPKTFASIPVPPPEAAREYPEEVNIVDNSVNAKTYTIPELAGLIGVKPSVLYGIRKSKSPGVLPGTAAAKACAYMQEHGITWDQVLAASHGPQKKEPAIPAAPRFEPEPLEEPVPSESLPLISDCDEPEAQAAPVEDGLPEGAGEGRLVAQPSMTPMKHYFLADYKLEDLLAELTRRLPRAEVVLR